MALLADIVTSIDSPNVGICLDTVNSFGSLEGPAVVVEALGPYVVNLHVKDFSIRRHDHNMGFTLTGTPAGQGQLDLPWLLGAFLINFVGCLLLGAAGLYYLQQYRQTRPQPPPLAPVQPPASSNHA